MFSRFALLTLLTCSTTSALATAALPELLYMGRMSHDFVVEHRVGTNDGHIYERTRNIDNGVGNSVNSWSISSSPAPAAMAFSAASNFTAHTETDIDYQFRITGPAFTQIPITFRSSFLVSIQPQTQFGDGNILKAVASASFAGNSRFDAIGEYSGSCLCMDTTFRTIQTDVDPTYRLTNENRGLNSWSGTVLGTTSVTTDGQGLATSHIVLNAYAFSYHGSLYGAGLGNSAMAWIDPVIGFDPVWAAAHPGATLAFATGVGNSISPVPEAASAAYMLLGLLGLLGFSRRRLKGL